MIMISYIRPKMCKEVLLVLAIVLTAAQGRICSYIAILMNFKFIMRNFLRTGGRNASFSVRLSALARRFGSYNRCFIVCALKVIEIK